MKKPVWVRVFLVVACASVFFQSNFAFCADSVAKESYLNFTLPPPDSAQTQAYLGLDAIRPFKLTDIKAKIAVIELMNTLCAPCKANVPIMNDIYEKLRTDSGSADIKVIVIAIADDKSRVEAFKKEFKTLFPILLDESGAIQHSMPGLSAPTTMVVSTGDAKVLFTHNGVIDDADGFVKQVKFVKQLESMDNEK